MTDALERQLGAIARELGGDAADVKLERPRNPDHGDVASNLALVLAGRLGAASCGRRACSSPAPIT
jgi:arginyl-tRNA synthetase